MPQSNPRHQLRVTIITVIISWTFIYNIFIKEMDLLSAFFGIIDTISDDFIIGSIFTILIGLGIVIIFFFTKLYSQVVANAYSFKILEILYYNDLRKGNIRGFISKVVRLEDQPYPNNPCPNKISFLLFAFTFLYIFSWVYIVIFSEALFFISWSAGVDLPLTSENLLLLPTVALAIPFSARVMAYLRYPYAQDYANFIPGSVFVLLLVATLGYLFHSEDQKFFLPQIIENSDYLAIILRNGAFLAFIPVFFEAMFWLACLGVNNNSKS